MSIYKQLHEMALSTKEFRVWVRSIIGGIKNEVRLSLICALLRAIGERKMHKNYCQLSLDERREIYKYLEGGFVLPQLKLDFVFDRVML